LFTVDKSVKYVVSFKQTMTGLKSTTGCAYRVVFFVIVSEHPKPELTINVTE